MAALGVTYPIKAGSIRGCIQLTGVTDTSWHTLTSADFKDSVSGAGVTAGLKFAWLGVINLSETTTAFVKYRAASGGGDTTVNEIPVLPYSAHTDDLATLSLNVTSVAYKKGEAAAEFYIIAGFDH